MGYHVAVRRTGTRKSIMAYLWVGCIPLMMVFAYLILSPMRGLSAVFGDGELYVRVLGQSILLRESCQVLFTGMCVVFGVLFLRSAE